MEKPMYKHILPPTDGSALSRQACQVGVRLAQAWARPRSPSMSCPNRMATYWRIGCTMIRRTRSGGRK